MGAPPKQKGRWRSSSLHDKSYQKFGRNSVFVPSKSESVLSCTINEPVSSGAVSRKCSLEDTHNKSINFEGGVGEEMSVESNEIRSEVHNTGFKVMALNIFLFPDASFR